MGVVAIFLIIFPCSVVAGSAALDVVEKLLLSLVAMDGMPPSDWSGILSMLYHKGMDVCVTKN